MASARDRNLSSFLDSAIDDILRSTTLTGINVSSLTTMEANLITLGILEEGHGRSPRELHLLSQSLNKGIRTKNYSDFFSRMSKMKEYTMTENVSFQDSYDAVFAKKTNEQSSDFETNDRKKAMETRSEVAQALYDLKLDKKHGESKLDKALANDHKKLTEAWKMLSAVSYSEKLFTESRSQIEYLRSFQDKVLSNFAYPPEEGAEGAKRPVLKESVRDSINTLGAGFNIPGLITERINGSLVSSNIDLGDKTCYDLSSYKNRHLTNTGVKGVKCAAEQINSVMAYPYIAAITGNVTADRDLYNNASSDLVSLMCYPGEKREKVFGGNGRWDKYGQLINNAFDSRILSGLKNSNFGYDEWRERLKDGDTLSNEEVDVAIKEMKADMVHRLALRGSFGVKTVKEFARELMLVSLDPEFVNTHMNPEMVYKADVVKKSNAPSPSLVSPTGTPSQPTHVSGAGVPGIDFSSGARTGGPNHGSEMGPAVLDNRTSEKFVLARVVTADGGVYVPETFKTDANGNIVFADNEGRFPVYEARGAKESKLITVNGHKTVSPEEKNRILNTVQNTYRDANLENCEVVLGNTPMTAVAERVFQMEDLKPQEEETEAKYSGPQMYRDLNVYKAAYQSAAELIKQFI